MFLVCGLVGALIQGGVVRRRIRKGRGAQVHCGGLVISAIGFLLLVTAHSLVTATIYLAIFGIGNALIRPCVTSLITQKTTVGQGVASGLSSSMDSFGRIIGPLFGRSAVSGGYRAALCGRRILSFAALLLLLRFRFLDPSTEPVQLRHGLAACSRQLQKRSLLPLKRASIYVQLIPSPRMINRNRFFALPFVVPNSRPLVRHKPRG